MALNVASKVNTSLLECIFLLGELRSQHGILKDITSFILRTLRVLTKPPSLPPLSINLHDNYQFLSNLNWGHFDPCGIVVGKEGRIFISDGLANTIRVFLHNGSYFSSFGKKGTALGLFNSPTGLAIDFDYNIIICDSLNKRLQIWSNELSFLTSIPTTGVPNDVAVSSTGKIVTALSSPSCISVFSSKGNHQIEFKFSGDNWGDYPPKGISIDSQDNIYVASWRNHVIEKYDSNGVFLKNLGVGLAMSFPVSVVVDGEGRVAVADSNNSRMLLMNSDGEKIFEFGGKGTGDGEFRIPRAVAMDLKGNLLVGDKVNGRVCIFTK